MANPLGPCRPSGTARALQARLLRRRAGEV